MPTYRTENIYTVYEYCRGGRESLIAVAACLGSEIMAPLSKPLFKFTIYIKHSPWHFCPLHAWYTRASYNPRTGAQLRSGSLVSPHRPIIASLFGSHQTLTRRQQSEEQTIVFHWPLWFWNTWSSSASAHGSRPAVPAKQSHTLLAKNKQAHRLASYYAAQHVFLPSGIVFKSLTVKQHSS